MYARQQTVISAANASNIAIYVHWPFCISKCPYCDFNSHVAGSMDVDAFIQGYLTQLEHFRTTLAGKTITSVYFGGGTPSLAPTQFFALVLDKLAQISVLAPDAEITMEANPSSSEVQKFMQIRDTGVNRVSIGIQSFNEDELRFLGRAHSSQEAHQAIEAAAKAFQRYSFDLIYALPGQTVAGWEAALQAALRLADGHISLYQLTIEKGTPFHKDHKHGKFQLLEGEQAALMYEVTEGVAGAAGLPAYEVSNYARAGLESRHNLAYWRYQDYLGVGPGAHSRLIMDGVGGGKQAMMMWHAPGKWREMVDSGPYAAIQSITPLSSDDQYEEMLMMSMRLVGGVELAKVRLERAKLTELVEQGLLVIDEGNAGTGPMLRTTLKGRLLLNYVLARILA